ncbi:MAG: hypothetical protein OHK0046_10840 [Anaerolineae bacterium]
MSDVILQSVLRFTDEDLAANRQKRLSPAQQQHLNQQLMQWAGTATAALGFAAFLFLIVQNLLFIAIVSGLAGLYFLYRTVMVLSDLRAGEVANISGKAHIERKQQTDDDAERKPQYILTIGLKRFEGISHVIGAFEEGHDYIVYYAPRSEQILSAERIEYA